MAVRDWHSKYEGQEVEEMLDSVHNKTIYDKATVSKDGLMSSGDKEKLNGLEDFEPMTNMEIQSVINLIF